MSTDDRFETSAYGDGRVTASRRIIAREAAELERAFTVEELAALVREVDSAAGAPATVYRAVAAMESAGSIVRVGQRGLSALYARCSEAAHHHHVVCDSCGRVGHTTCPLPTPAADAGGFVVTRHEVTLYGLCPSCARSSEGC